VSRRQFLSFGTKEIGVLSVDNLTSRYGRIEVLSDPDELVSPARPFDHDERIVVALV
jgi:hypothetical protein